jgi:stage V sporulation protein S
MRSSTWESDTIPSLGEMEDPPPVAGASGYAEDRPAADAQLLRVSARSQPGLLAGAIAGIIRSGEAAQLQAIGAGAVNQAVKAVATARVYLAPEGVDIMCMPEFAQVQLDGLQRTAIAIRVEALNAPPGDPS